MSDTPNVTFEVNLSEASIDRLAERLSSVITDGLGEGFQRSFTDFNATTRRMQESFARAVADMRRNMNRAFDPSQLRQTVGSVDEISQAVLRASQLFEKMGRSELERISLTARAREQERAIEISRRAELVQAEKQKTAIVEAEGKKQAIEAQRVAQLQIVEARAAGKQRVLITQETLRTLARLERGFGAVVSGVARTATSAVSRSFSGLGRLLSRQNAEFSQGLGSSLRTRESLISRSFSSQERLLRDTVTRQSTIINNLNRQVSTGLTGAVTGRGVGGGLIGGLAAGAGLTALLTSGFQRFSDLERINKQFVALTGNIADANKLLAEARDFAKTTPFDLVGVSDLVKGFLAIGSSAEEAMKQVRVISDAVAFTGGGNDALVRIQRAIGQVVSAGRLQGDELNQLAENLPGLNIRQILADQLTGGNVRALVEMQEAGELTADQFVSGLITGLGSDPRLVGAAQDLAETLSGRAANLKESFADLGAAIIGAVSGPLKFLILQTQTGLQGLADFIKGSGLNDQLLLLRDALRGVALGMGAVIAAKGAVEVIKLLGTSLNLLLTPFGAVLAIAGLFGAAISVMVSRSDELRATFGVLGERFGDLAARISREFQPIIERAGNFVDKTLVPAIDRAAQFLADSLLPALDATIRFISDTAIPVVERLGARVVGLARDGFGVLTDIAARVEPFLRPAIEGFRELGRVISDAFGGDLSGLGRGFGAALSGIGATASLIGSRILEALQPVGERIVTFFAGIFTGDNLRRLASGFLNVVEEVGRLLGGFVSNPTFLTAVAGVAAAAALIAIRFVEGFAKGLLSNFDEIANLIRELMVLAFKAALDNIGLVIIAGLGALLLGPRIRALFSQSGTQAAAGFSQGFLGRLRAGVGAQTLLFRSLFDGQAFARHVSNQATKAAISIQRQFNAGNALLRNAGFDPIPAKNIVATNSELQRVQGRLKEVRTLIGDAAFATLQTRTTMQAVTETLRGWGTVLRTDIPQSFRFLRSQGQSFTQSLVGAMKGGFDAIKAIATDQGVSIGTVLGKTIGNAASSALIITGGFLGGRAEGQSGGSGLLSVLTAGATGLALGGPITGIAAGAAAFIGAQIGKNNAAVQKMKEQVEALSRAFSDDLVSAIKEGTLALAELQDGLDFAEARGVSGVLDAARQSFAEALSDKQLALLDQFGFTIDKNVIPALERANGDLDTFGRTVQRNFLTAAAASDEFRDRFGQNATAISGILADIAAPGGAANISDFVSSSQFSQLSQEMQDLIIENQKWLDSILSTSGALEDQGVILQRALDRARLLAIQTVGGTGVNPGTSDLNVQFNQSFVDPKDLEDVARGFIDAGLSIDDTRREMERLGLEAPAALDRWNRDLERVGKTVDALNSRFADLVASVDDAFARPAIDQAVDRAIVNAKEIADRIKEAQQAAADGAAGLSAQNLAIDDFTSEITGIIQQGIEDGIIVDRNSAIRAVQPFLDAFFAQFDPNDPAMVDLANQIFKSFGDGLTGLEPTIEEAAAVREAAKFQTAVQLYLKDHPLSTEVEARVMVNREQLTQDLQQDSAGRQALLNGQVSPEDIFPMPSQSEVETAFGELAQGVTDGIVGGLTDEANVQAVGQAAAGLGSSIEDSFSRRLAISSPSKIMFRKGFDVARGLELGIKAGRSLVIQAAISIAQAAIDAANRTLDMNSPSRVMFHMGENVSSGFAAGITSRAQEVADASAQLAAIASTGFNVSNGLPDARFPDATRAAATTSGGRPAGAFTAADIETLGRTIAREARPNVTIDQQFHERADSQAIATDIAWKLTSV